MTAQERFTRRLETGLTQRRDKHLERALILPSGIDFTSNDYLGIARSLTNDPSSEVPFGSTASRLLRGHHEIHRMVENRLAAFSGTESSLLFTSGYALNAGIYSALIGPNDIVFSDALNHASIIDGLRLTKTRKEIFPHQDFEYLEKLLQTVEAGKQAFVVTESLFSMDGDITDLPRLSALCEKYDALLIVDEAHATGIFGERGAGLIEQSGVRSKVLLSIHTAGKALGTQGAWVAASDTIIQHLVNHCRSFIYSTGISPHLAQALARAVSVVETSTELRQRAASNAEYFRHLAQTLRLPFSSNAMGPIIPIIVGDAERSLKVASSIQAAGFDVRAIRPPTVPPGTSRLRVVIHAVHELETLDELAKTIAHAMKENP